MADDADLAAEIASRIDLTAPVAAIRGRLAVTGRATCLDCGATIPAERRMAYRAATRCVDCQAQWEG